MTLMAENQYTHTWYGLPASANNDPVRWTIRETKIGTENCKADYSFANWITSYRAPRTDENGDIYTAGENIINSIENIKLIAKEELSKHNCNYNVNVSFGKSDFPTKDYGNFVLPAGRYNALKVEIGKASGQNWWCVLFPPLCFVDAGTITSSGRLTDDIEKNIGSDRMYLIDKSSSSETKVKFKTYEMWQKSKQKLAMLFE